MVLQKSTVINHTRTHWPLYMYTKHMHIYIVTLCTIFPCSHCTFFSSYNWLKIYIEEGGALTVKNNYFFVDINRPKLKHTSMSKFDFLTTRKNTGLLKSQIRRPISFCGRKIKSWHTENIRHHQLLKTMSNPWSKKGWCFHFRWSCWLPVPYFRCRLNHNVLGDEICL